MRITKIQIKNYRSFNDSGEQDITKLFALIGKNNSGKSAFIEAIQCVWGEKKLSKEDAHKNNKAPIEIRIIIEKRKDDTGDSEELEQHEIIASYENGISAYRLDGKNQKTAPKNLPKLLLIPAIRNPKAETTAQKNSFLNELIASIISLKIDDIPDINAFKNKTVADLNIDEIKALLDYRTAVQLKSIGDLTTKHLHNSLEDTDINLSIRPEGDLSKAVNFSTKVRDTNLGDELHEIDILNCGTGLQSMGIMALLQAYADLNQHEDSILLIEEPEVYLHPDLQRKMFAVLRQIAKRTQVIFTTHSPIMISDLWNNSVRLITRQKGETKISTVNIQEVIKELGIRYEDILNPDVVVFVEGPEDIAFYKRVIALRNPELCEAIERRVKFIDTGGFKSMHIYALMSILLKTNVTAKFFMIVDGDGETGSFRKDDIFNDIKARMEEGRISISEDKLKAFSDNISPLSRYSIESYLLDYQLLVKLNSEISKEDYQSFVEHYEATYKKVQKKGLDRLRFTLKPKLLFQAPNNENQWRAMKNEYGSNEKFFEVRKKIETAWTNCCQSKRCPISIMVDETTINCPILDEPIKIIEGVLEASGIALVQK